jgi:alpha-tubulin suppressor-like RCC1 family protein
MVVGDSVRLAILLRDKVGYPLTGRSVAWTTSQPAVATVSQAGTVNGVGVGSVSITATVEGKTGTALVTVSPSFPAAAFVSVTAGGAHSCALTASGAAHCWGRGESGQLGVPPPEMMCLVDLDYPCSLVPVPVDGGLAFQLLTAGGAHTCGLTSDGSAWCWGSNAFGQLGDSTVVTRNAPVPVATTLKFASIDAGPDHTCGLTRNGKAWCWGRNNNGQLGDSTTADRSVPVPVSNVGDMTFSAVSAGGSDRSFTCALTSAGETYCWGYNGFGVLGLGNQDFVPHPVPALVSGDFRFASLSVGLGNHVCGLTAAGAAHCWGSNVTGELGNVSAQFVSPLPVVVSGGIVFAGLVTGGYFDSGGHTCGLTSSGAAYCWGSNQVGAIGDGSSVDRRTTPTAVVGGLTFASIDAGFRHSCARTNTGTLYCWGSGRTGQLGANVTSSSAVPVKVIGQP